MIDDAGLILIVDLLVDETSVAVQGRIVDEFQSNWENTIDRKHVENERSRKWTGVDFLHSLLERAMAILSDYSELTSLVIFLAVTHNLPPFQLR